MIYVLVLCQYETGYAFTVCLIMATYLFFKQIHVCNFSHFETIKQS